MAYGNLISGVVFLTLGLVIQTGKVSFLIAGYNTMSAEEKSKINIRAMSKFIGLVMLSLPAVILLLASIPMFLNFHPTFMIYLSWLLFMAIITGGVIYMNTGSRFKITE